MPCTMKPAQQAKLQVTIHTLKEAGVAPIVEAFTAAKHIGEELDEEKKGEGGAAGTKSKKAAGGGTSCSSGGSKSVASSSKKGGTSKTGKGGRPAAAPFGGMSLGAAHKGMMDMSDIYKSLE